MTALLNLRGDTPISASILSGVQSFLAERNLNLIFAHGTTDEALPQAVRSGNVDGILGYGEFPESAITSSLRRIPAVWLMTRGSGGADVWGDRVKPDHSGIGRLAGEYLLARGHEHVAYFNPSPMSSTYIERGEWFKRTLDGRVKSFSVFAAPNDGIKRVGAAWLAAAAEACVQQWIAASPRPTGVFCPIDPLTLRVYSQFLRAGIRPGEDVEIVSCDNQAELLSLVDPPPASIDLNRSTIARLAVERLLWRMRHGMSSPSITVTVSPTLNFESVTRSPAAR